MLYEVITIMVISAVLSGFSSSFSMGDQLFPITLRDGRMTDLSICYHPSIPGVKESEIVITSYSIHYTKLYEI